MRPYAPSFHAPHVHIPEAAIILAVGADAPEHGIMTDKRKPVRVLDFLFQSVHSLVVHLRFPFVGRCLETFPSQRFIL